jgi:YidC/Oxa1 family membrane protein insertase
VYEDIEGMSMLPMSLMALVQVPVTLGVFFGVKHLCAEACALTFEQFQQSDVSSLPDLTVLDPYYVLHRDCILYLNVNYT